MTELLVDEVESPYRELLECLARERGLTVRVAGRSGAGAGGGHPALCVLGSRAPHPDLLDRVRALRRRQAYTPIVVVSPSLGCDRVVQLMKLGVSDVIEVPAEPDAVAKRALRSAVDGEADSLREELLGASPEMEEVRRWVATVAPMGSTVLLTGETGTGKGLVARSIHRLSDRREQPLIHADCASLSASVIESEFFGHERGAFTGASSRRRGRFELAAGGTIFLDEIGDIEGSLQAKLLRVLQDREFERVGGSQTLKMSARVIAATNRDLEDAVRAGKFREDLYFRLNVIRLDLPPVRERRGDIPALVHRSLQSTAGRLGVPVPQVTTGFIAHLAALPLPGNVRQIENIAERLLIRRPGATLDADDLNDLMSSSVGPRLRDAPRRPEAAAGEPCAAPEDLAVLLAETGGNVARAARRLRIPRSTLRYWIRKHGLTDVIPKD